MDGATLKKLRESKNLTQIELAELVGTSKQTIWNYENSGTIPKTKIAILKKFLETDNDIEIEIKTDLQIVEYLYENKERFLKMQSFQMLLEIIFTQEYTDKLLKRLKSKENASPDSTIK